jgi:hypothetical protein
MVSQRHNEKAGTPTAAGSAPHEAWARKSVWPAILFVRNVIGTV